MSSSEDRLRAFMKEKGIQAKYFRFQESCHSVEEAARAAGADPQDFIKNICMLDSQDRAIVAIVKGEDRASTKRVAIALGLGERPRAAGPEEILEKTGYPCGGLPSFGYQATFLIDPMVMDKELVWTSGGSENSLVRVSPEEIQRTNEGKMVRVRK